VSTIQVSILGDTLVEKNESFLLRLRDPLNASFTRSSALGIIINHDSPSNRLPATSGVRESKLLIPSLRPPDVFVGDLNSSN